MKRAVLFDLDGTLLDTLDDLADAMNAALERTGFPSLTSRIVLSLFCWRRRRCASSPRAAIQRVYSFGTCSTSRGHGRRIRPEMAGQEPSL